ncbi:peptidylprolyl isomerase [Desulfocurvus sp. DL9XJH121]
MKRILLACIVLAWVLGSLSGCAPEPDAKGVVARVNGRPVTMERLQVRYDFKKLSVAADNPSVAALKKEYGHILADIVVEELVSQELEARGLAVTPEELAEAEADIRSDYPEGAFEQVLVEEYIDIESWRQELRSRLTMEKFFHEVLRPGITIGYEEAEAYYRERIQDFFLPARVRFHLVSGPSRDAIESAMQSYRSGESIEDQPGKFDRVHVREVRVREDQLTVTWKNALKGLGPGEASSVIADKGGYEVLIYDETIPARVLDPSQAYPVVERMLVDAKLREAFDHWLEGRLATADISVSALLPMNAKDEAAQADTGEPAAETVPPQAQDMPGEAPPSDEEKAPAP